MAAINLVGGESSKSTPSKRATFGGNQATARSVKSEAEGSGYGGAAGVSGDYNSIFSLNPYQKKWTIRARVTDKKELKTYQKKQSGGGEGQILKLVLTDATGEISATAWNEDAVRFNAMLVKDVVCIIQGGRLQQVKAQFAGPVKNDYEIMLGKETIIILEQDAADLPTTSYNFTKISNLVNAAADTFVDVIGVIRNVGETTTIISKTTQKVIPKRDVELIDDTNTSVMTTLWDANTALFDAVQPGEVVALKGCKISDWNTRSLSCGNACTVSIGPQISEANQLRDWAVTKCKDTVPQCLSIRGTEYAGAAGGGAGGGNQLKSFEQAFAEKLGMKEEPDYFNNLCYVLNLNKDKIGYEACPTQGCMKKVIANEAGSYRCEKCNRDVGKPVFRLLASVHVADATLGVWTTFFGGETEKLLGKTSAEVGVLHDSGDDLKGVVQQAIYTQHMLRFRAKQDTFNDEVRVKWTVQSIVPMTPRQRCEQLITLMQASDIEGL